MDEQIERDNVVSGCSERSMKLLTVCQQGGQDLEQCREAREDSAIKDLAVQAHDLHSYFFPGMFFSAALLTSGRSHGAERDTAISFTKLLHHAHTIILFNAQQTILMCYI